MGKMWKTALVLSFSLLAVGPALAQGEKKGGPPGGFPFGGGMGGRGAQDPAALLNNPSVQKELKLSEDQQKKVPEAVMKALKEVLEPDQVKRLKQIQLQLR